jgi:hypothetical protein
MKYNIEDKSTPTLLWIVFWLLVLFTGDPDIHDAIIAFIGRH